jgi:hypothetical protein
MAWDPTITPQQAYTEWIAKTFGPSFTPQLVANLTELLTISEDATTKLAMYHGYRGTVRVFRHKCTLEDAIGSHACPLEAAKAGRCVTNGILLGWPLVLPVHTVNCVQTPKAYGMSLNRTGSVHFFSAEFCTRGCH